MKKNSDNISLGILDVIAIVFIILKLLDIIAWSWIWVLAPIWIPVCIVVIIWVLAHIFR